jgi:peptidoglycan-associated lipoprotein
MRSTPLKLMLVAGLVATAACGKKKTDLPPPPPPPAQAAEVPPPPPSAPSGPVTSSVAPGSLEDMIQQAGSDRVFFGYDSYDGEGRDVLTKQAAWLQKYPAKRITIEGHADERGTREYNLALGDRRANAAKNFLAAQGVSASRISTISYGKERPAEQGSDESAYSKNRRAVTVLN